jgi:phosphoribosylformylglycinamidine synthase
MVLKWQGDVVADIPLAPLADEAPLYDRPHVPTPKPAPLANVPESTDLTGDLVALMGSPDIASRRWIWEQYDHMVGADTVQRPGGDAAVVRVHGTQKGLAITTDCTPRYCFADPVEGGRQAVAEAWRNLTSVGANPLAVTNCLNFANPQRPEIMGQIVGCLEGMSEACLALDFPIVSGNVSLYNESKATGGGSAILPTPAIGAIGLLADWSKSCTIGFKNAGDTVLAVGERGGDLGQSLWLREIHGREDGPPPPVDLTAERRTGDFIRKMIEKGAITACHDVSDGHAGGNVACLQPGRARQRAPALRRGGQLLRRGSGPVRRDGVRYLPGRLHGRGTCGRRSRRPAGSGHQGPDDLRTGRGGLDRHPRRTARRS